MVNQGSGIGEAAWSVVDNQSWIIKRAAGVVGQYRESSVEATNIVFHFFAHYSMLFVTSSCLSKDHRNCSAFDNMTRYRCSF
jgi:hypothetical protein